MDLGHLLYSGLDQIQAIRESLLKGLNGVIAVETANPDPHKIARWLDEQGMSELPAGEIGPSIWWAISQWFERRFGNELETLVKRSAAPHPKLFEIGEKRSGAGWKDPANFIITSAFVRLLGSEEQYEMDVLKALFYYRPSGPLGNELDQDTIRANVEDFFEEPEHRRTYTKPAVWTWLRKHAENNVEREKIFKNVFDISTIPGDYSKKKTDWYEKRNSIAHGRKGIVMSLSEYSDVEVFVAKTMTYISEQCCERLKLIV
jgi:hypothetical protein